MARSSSLVAPPTSSQHGSSGSVWETVAPTPIVASGFPVEMEIHSKKELPGRTMEFTFDVSQTPVIGRRHPGSNNAIGMKDEGLASTAARNLGFGQTLAFRSGSVGDSGHNMGNCGNGFIQSGWKRPWQCQSRVREALVSVLNACGQRVGLPKSPSVSKKAKQHAFICAVSFVRMALRFLILNQMFISFSGYLQSKFRTAGEAEQCSIIDRRSICSKQRRIWRQSS